MGVASLLPRYSAIGSSVECIGGSPATGVPGMADPAFALGVVDGGAYNGHASALAKTAMPFEGFLGQMRNPSNDMPAYAAQVMS